MKATVIRTPLKDIKEEENSLEFINRIAQEQKTVASAAEKNSKHSSSANQSRSAPLIQEIHVNQNSSPKPHKLKIPHYDILHSDSLSYQNFTNERERTNGGRPKALTVRIELPEVDSVSEVNLDTDVQSLDLSVPNKYILHLELPFPVDHDNGNAKFLKGGKRGNILSVYLPVVPCAIEKLVRTIYFLHIEYLTLFFHYHRIFKA